MVTAHGGPDVLHVVEEALPVPQPGEARVRVLAAGVSAFDLIYRRWPHLPGSPKLPFTLGEDIVGVVDCLGEGVGSLDEGQLVAAATWAGGFGGGYAEYVTLPVSELVAVPSGVDPAEAVCVVVNYLTAHLHLHHYGQVQSGERVLVHGAAGGVGTALLELGRLAGLEMYGTASREDHDLVTAMGATPIDYKREDFVERIRLLTTDGVDVVVDPVGGAKHLWDSYRCLRRGGRLVWLGSAATETQGLRTGPLSMAMTYLLKVVPDRKQVPVCATTDKHARKHPDWYRTTLQGLLDSLANGNLKPVIAERVPLAEASRAHQLLESGHHHGKIVLVTQRGRAATFVDGLGGFNSGWWRSMRFRR